MPHKRAAACLLRLGFLASAAVMAAGAWRLFKVGRSMEDGADAARAALLETRMAVVYLPIAGAPAEADITVHSTAKEKDAGDAIALITFHHTWKRVEIALFSGTSDDALERGAGWTEQSAYPNEPGRCIVHGHRDSAFKPLSTIEEGDHITLTTEAGSVDYTVRETYVTHPSDPAIYEQPGGDELELVTCYPFTFVGHAPDRFVAIAVPTA